MIKVLKIAFTIIFIMSIGSFAQNDTKRMSTGDLYQDLSRYSDVKDAKFVLVLNKDSVHIDTTVLRKINTVWIEKVETFTKDKNQKSSPTESVFIYVRSKYVKKAKDVIEEMGER
jgi:hypothetical protein